MRFGELTCAHVLLTANSLSHQREENPTIDPLRKDAGVSKSRDKSIKFTYNQGAGTESGIVALLNELTSVVSGYGNGPVDDARYVVAALLGFSGCSWRTGCCCSSVVCHCEKQVIPGDQACLPAAHALSLSYYVNFQSSSRLSKLCKMLARTRSCHKYSPTSCNATHFPLLKSWWPWRPLAWLVRTLIGSAIAAVDTRSSEDNSREWQHQNTSDRRQRVDHPPYW